MFANFKIYKPGKEGIMKRSGIQWLAVLLIISSFGAGNVIAQHVEVGAHQKISDTQGGFTGDIRSLDLFGSTLDNLGDMDGDGVIDLGVGVHDDDGGFDRGALWILYMNADGTVKRNQKISDLAGGFTGILDDSDVFGGGGVTSLGDLDGDGAKDIAVGAPGDDDGGTNRGAIWILFLNPDGTVKSHQKISDTSGNLRVGLKDFNVMMNPTNIGDLNGDGVVDIATGSWRSNTVWILFLNRDGTVKNHRIITAGEAGFVGEPLMEGFGSDVGYAGDINRDGVPDLIVGELGDSEAGTQHGAAWILFLRKNGAVKAEQKINELQGGFEAVLRQGDEFGTSASGVGDVDGDGISDVAVGARMRLSDAPNPGAAWILLMRRDGTVKATHKISDLAGGFTGDLNNGDDFGSGVAGLGDLNNDGMLDVAVAALADDDGGANRGAVWVMFLDVPMVKNFSLIDAVSNQPVPGFDPIPEGAVLNLARLPGALNIRANTLGTMESVRFAFEGDVDYQVENVAPYALFGDVSGDYAGGTFTSGLNKLIAFPFTENNAQGEAGVRGRLSFTVRGGTTKTPFAQDNPVFDINTFALEEAYPNPFNPSTTLRFAVPAPSAVTLRVYDLLGREIKTLVEGTVDAGIHEVVFDAGALPNGVYLYRLDTPTNSFVRQMVLMK